MRQEVSIGDSAQPLRGPVCEQTGLHDTRCGFYFSGTAARVCNPSTQLIGSESGFGEAVVLELGSDQVVSVVEAQAASRGDEQRF